MLLITAVWLFISDVSTTFKLDCCRISVPKFIFGSISTEIIFALFAGDATEALKGVVPDSFPIVNFEFNETSGVEIVLGFLIVAEEFFKTTEGSQHMVSARNCRLIEAFGEDSIFGFLVVTGESSTGCVALSYGEAKTTDRFISMHCTFDWI